MTKPKLGRGLGSLLSSTEEPATAMQGVAGIPTGAIHPNRYQPRTGFEPELLAELQASIAANGIIQPIVVRPHGNEYELIAGERRWRAASQLGMATIPAIVREVDDVQALEIALIENVQREDLNPIEMATAYHELMSRFALTQEEVAKRVGKRRSTVANTLRLLDLPADIQDFVSRGTLTMGHARALLGLVDTDAQRRLARRIVSQGLSVRAIEKIVQAANEPQQPKSVRYKSPHLRDIEDRLRRVLGTRVTIHEGHGRGRIVIDFYSNDDFDRILEKLS